MKIILCTEKTFYNGNAMTLMEPSFKNKFIKNL